LGTYPRRLCVQQRCKLVNQIFWRIVVCCRGFEFYRKR